MRARRGIAVGITTRVMAEGEGGGWGVAENRAKVERPTRAGERTRKTKRASDEAAMVLVVADNKAPVV